MSDETLTAPVYIAPTHPSLAGHFPGRPVVPGVVLLDCVAAELQRVGAGHLRRIRALKFLAPLLPGERAQLTLVRNGEQVRFRIERDGVAILSGDAQAGSLP